ncbi:hypothetical protein [Salinispora sp. H7-4]|uniref:hypothetical protein n=1 Tax=Salinispora sp. H7-4 TaxID=2748321 RepID=UPI0015D266A8|nr:hypothetical protein [Salinispora sp. H7-4]NYT95269.1 hypothetical protein [Salinispora sp. H7-4]
MGDDWLAGENIDVDIQQLDAFAAAIMDELNVHFTPGYEQGVAPTLHAPAPFGEGGLQEGQYFQARHEYSRLAMQALIAEAAKGLASLSMAAKSISADYLTEDALAEVANDDVLNAFRSVEGQATLDSTWQQGDNAVAPSTGEPRA